MTDGTQLARALFDRDLRLGYVLTVGDVLAASGSVGASATAAPPARADGTVGDDPRDTATQYPVIVTESHRENSAAMEHTPKRALPNWMLQAEPADDEREHERRARLARWQETR